MGPLRGMRVVEIGSIGPGPFCAQMLADMGADIIRIDRKVSTENPLNSMFNTMLRSRRSVTVDLKKSEGVETVLRLIEKADALVEGFRPGVTERLGIGPVVSLKRNPKLIYGRMTGWGQTGPLSEAAGHDINYIALSGALHAIGHKGKEPVPPLNLVGDFGGGGMMLAFGIMCALFEAQQSGKGQVVDASMVEGSAAMLSMFYGMMAAGGWSDQRGTNLLDGGAHFYSTYETSDNKWIAVGAIEPQFYKLLLEKAEIIDPAFENQMDSSKWPELKEMLAAIFKTKTRDEWCDLLEGTDACFSPVLSFSEAARHPHNVARQSFVEVDGIKQPAPAPKFSRTKPEIQGPPPTPGQHNETALVDWGFDADEIRKLIEDGVV
ncbi:MAG: CoA transferase [Proteobacteria bacterium]|nr:CoA transferase [Pseudomonadota bacterium]